MAKTKKSPTPAEVNTAIALFGRPDIEALWKLCAEDSPGGSTARIRLALVQLEQNGSLSSDSEGLKAILLQKLACLQVQEA